MAYGARLGIQELKMSETAPPPKPFVDLSDENVHWDLGESLSYSQYLNLDKLLDAQHPLSYQHDEMLFIVIHQVAELWMKLCLHELGATVDCVRRDDLGPTFKMLARVSTIQQQLLQSWDVLATITPYDYSAFRNTWANPPAFNRRSTGCWNFSSATKAPIPSRCFAAIRKPTRCWSALCARPACTMRFCGF
jgi:hypothetical protein